MQLAPLTTGNSPSAPEAMHDTYLHGNAASAPSHSCSGRVTSTLVGCALLRHDARHRHARRPPSTALAATASSDGRSLTSPIGPNAADVTPSYASSRTLHVSAPTTSYASPTPMRTRGYPAAPSTARCACGQPSIPTHTSRCQRRAWLIGLGIAIGCRPWRGEGTGGSSREGMMATCAHGRCVTRAKRCHQRRAQRRSLVACLRGGLSQSGVSLRVAGGC